MNEEESKAAIIVMKELRRSLYRLPTRVGLHSKMVVQLIDRGIEVLRPQLLEKEALEWERWTSN